MIIKDKIATVLHRSGVSADFLSFAGFFFAFLSAVLIYGGYFFLGGFVVLVSGILDLLDGAVARASGKAGGFGGILDSSLDRYGDGAILSALALFFARGGEFLYAGLAMSALVGSFSISYVRARAESVIENCKVGFWERGERLICISLGLALNNARLVLWVLAVVTHVTAVERLVRARAACRGQALGAPPGRRSPFYAVEAVFWILLVVFCRI